MTEYLAVYERHANTEWSSVLDVKLGSDAIWVKYRAVSLRS